jgi:hypothetical protein
MTATPVNPARSKRLVWREMMRVAWPRPGWLPDLDRSVSLLDGLAVADLADSPVLASQRATATSLVASSQ